MKNILQPITVVALLMCNPFYPNLQICDVFSLWIACRMCIRHCFLTLVHKGDTLGDVYIMISHKNARDDSSSLWCKSIYAFQQPAKTHSPATLWTQSPFAVEQCAPTECPIISDAKASERHILIKLLLLAP